MLHYFYEIHQGGWSSRSSEDPPLIYTQCIRKVFRHLHFIHIFIHIHSRTFRDLSRSHSCNVFVLRVIVLLEAEPSPQSEVLSGLEQVFIKDLAVLCSI